MRYRWPCKHRVTRWPLNVAIAVGVCQSVIPWYTLVTRYKYQKSWNKKYPAAWAQTGQFPFKSASYRISMSLNSVSDSKSVKHRPVLTSIPILKQRQLLFVHFITIQFTSAVEPGTLSFLSFYTLYTLFAGGITQFIAFPRNNYLSRLIIFLTVFKHSYTISSSIYTRTKEILYNLT